MDVSKLSDLALESYISDIQREMYDKVDDLRRVYDENEASIYFDTTERLKPLFIEWELRRHPRCFARRHNGWDIEEDSHAKID